MRQLEEMDFPNQVAESVIEKFNIDSGNIQDIKDFIYFCSELTSAEASTLINEVFDQVGD